MARTVRLLVNGTDREVALDAERTLLDVLRNELRLTGTKYGCGEGQCGACTVLLDGKPVRACTRSLSSCAGRSILTIEGLATGDALHPLQEAFLAENVMQCGYCTAGMIMSAVGLLARNSHPDESEIVAAMRGNICRCGTYPRIVRAVRLAARRRG